MWIAHLSDTHLDGQPAVRERAARVAAWLRELPTPPDLILVTGDVTEPYPGVDVRDEFAWLDETLRLDAAVHYCPGNSDERTAYRAFLDGRGDRYTEVDGQLHAIATVGWITLVLLDSTVPGSFAGRLGPNAVSWLRDRLAAIDGRVVLAMHHPPVPLGHPVVDELGLHDAGELEELVRGDPRIVATLCGHTHAAISATFAGRPLLVAPGVHSAGQLPLAMADPNPGLIDESSAPALALHRIDDSGGIITYLHTVAPA